MKRLIDANALKDDILKSAVMIDDRGIQTGYEIAIELIKRQPTIDAEPVRHGKWITCTSSEHWKCSECGCRAGYWFNEDNSGIESWEMDFSEWLSDYCPQCGARMDK
jgi:hypothetical protein